MIAALLDDPAPLQAQIVSVRRISARRWVTTSTVRPTLKASMACSTRSWCPHPSRRWVRRAEAPVRSRAARGRAPRAGPDRATAETPLPHPVVQPPGQVPGEVQDAGRPAAERSASFPASGRPMSSPVPIEPWNRRVLPSPHLPAPEPGVEVAQRMAVDPNLRPPAPETPTGGRPGPIFPHRCPRPARSAARGADPGPRPSAPAGDRRRRPRQAPAANAVPLLREGVSAPPHPPGSGARRTARIPSAAASASARA